MRLDCKKIKELSLFTGRGRDEGLKSVNPETSQDPTSPTTVLTWICYYHLGGSENCYLRELWPRERYVLKEEKKGEWLCKILLID